VPRKIELEVEVTADNTRGLASSVNEIENLEDRVKSLSASTNQLRKEKDATTAQLRLYNDAIKAGRTFTQEEAKELERLTARQKELASAVAHATSVERTARQELRNLTFAQRDAQREAQLLAAQFGVNLPRGLDQLLTRSKPVQGAISKVFNVALVASFAGAIGSQVIPALASMYKWLTDIGEANRTALQDIEAFNRAQQERTPAGLLDREMELRRQLDAEVQRNTHPFVDPDTGLIVPGKAFRETSVLEEQITSQIRAIQQKRKELLAKLNAVKLPGREVDDGTFTVTPVSATPLPGLPPSLNRGAFVTTPVSPSVARDPSLLTPEEREQQAQLEADRELARQDDVFQKSLAANREFNEERLRLEMEGAERHRLIVEQQGLEWEHMFDRTIGSARSFKDLLSNIWAEIAANAKREFFQGLAALTHGGSPSGATAGRGGGITGVLSSVFGAPTSISTGVATPPIVSTSRVVSTATPTGNYFLDASAGFPEGVTPVTTQATTAAALGLPSTTPANDVFTLGSLGRISGSTLLAGGALGLSQIGHRNRLVSGIGGFLGGGLAGLAIGGSSLLAGTAIGAFAGPIGALVGLGLGLASNARTGRAGQGT